MARRRTVTLVDDVDDSPADATITFALDGITYGIDLSSSNAAQLRTAMQPWMDSARPDGRPTPTRAQPPKRLSAGT